MNKVQALLLADARDTLLREIAGIVGKGDLQEAFAAWLVPVQVDGLCLEGPRRAALASTGARRTYQHVAILGYAAQTGVLGAEATEYLTAGLHWITGRDPVVKGTPMGFCTDSVALLGIVLGAKGLGQADVLDKVARWLGRCMGARAEWKGIEEWQESLLLAASHQSGMAQILPPPPRPAVADVRAALRSKGLLPDSTGISPGDDDYEALCIIQRETSAGIGVVRAALRLTALESLKAKKPENHPISEKESSNMTQKQKTQIDTRKVFVVHGRNQAARNALFTFLRAIGLHPLEWSEIVQATGKASPYIGEVLQTGFSIVQAVVVLMTPDDEARLREPYRGPNEPAHEIDLTPQPRPNVLLEAGMALGLFPERTVIVELGQSRPVSDIGGRHVIRMNDTPEKRQELAQRLETAGCTVNRTGTDWYKSGEFGAAL